MNILNAATTVAAGASVTIKKASAAAIAVFWGTWGTGGSVTLQYSPDAGGTWINLGSAATANGLQSIAVPPGLVRANVTAGTGISINVSLSNADVAL